MDKVDQGWDPLSLSSAFFFLRKLCRAGLQCHHSPASLSAEENESPIWVMLGETGNLEIKKGLWKCLDTASAVVRRSEQSPGTRNLWVQNQALPLYSSVFCKMTSVPLVPYSILCLQTTTILPHES